MPQQDLSRQIAEAQARPPAPRVAALAVAGDPFAAPPVRTHVEAKQGMDLAFAAVREDELAPGVPGIPSGKPAWLLPLIVGLLALVVGGAVTLVVMMR
jgi:hypothetical protein